MNNRENLKAYLDGELSSAEATQLEAALAEDASLRAEMDELRSLGSQVKSMAKSIPVMGAELALAQVRKPRFRFWKTGLAVSLCLAALVVFRPNRGMFQAEAESMQPLATTADAAADVPAEWQKSESGAGAGFANTRPKDKAVASDDPNLHVPAAEVPRQVIQTANLSLKVENASKAQAAAVELAKRLGGFATSSRETGEESQARQATVVIRVPVKHFESALGTLRKFGEVTAESTDGQDVTAEIADAAARLKVMRAEEESYVTMLRGARRVGELLEIKERLSSVRQQIESLDAQEKSLRNQAKLSTISLDFQERPKVQGSKEQASWSGDAWVGAVNGLKSAGRLVGTGVINLFVFAPLWLPLLFGGVLAWRKLF